MSNTFDPVWEKKYKENPNYRNYYPYDAIVSYIYLYAPRDVERKKIKILEVGCGCANNLWFAAREGFSVTGIDGSETAISFANDRFEKEGLEGDLRVGDMTELPLGSDEFDLVFDRAALTLVDAEGAKKAVREIHRTLKPGGFFYCNPFSDRDSSNYRSTDEDGMIRGIKVGTILGGSQTKFYSLQDVRDLFSRGWEIDKLKHIEQADMTLPERINTCEWQIIAKKI